MLNKFLLFRSALTSSVKCLCQIQDIHLELKGSRDSCTKIMVSESGSLEGGGGGSCILVNISLVIVITSDRKYKNDRSMCLLLLATASVCTVPLLVSPHLSLADIITATSSMSSTLTHSLSRFSNPHRSKMGGYRRFHFHLHLR